MTIYIHVSIGIALNHLQEYNFEVIVIVRVVVRLDSVSPRYEFRST